MKGKLLVWGFIFSVAVNVTALTTIGRYWLEQHHHEGRKDIIGRAGTEKGERHHGGHPHSRMDYLCQELALSESQAEEMESLRESLGSNMQGLKKDLREKRAALVALLTESEPDRKKIDEKLKEIASLQGDLQKLIIDNLLQQKEILTPEQRKKFFSLISRRICLLGEGHRSEGILPMMGKGKGRCEHKRARESN